MYKDEGNSSSSNTTDNTTQADELSEQLRNENNDSNSSTWLSSYTIEELYLQMCEGPQVEHSCDSGCKYVVRMSFHYVEVDNYARRASSGNFEGKNAKHKPRVIINAVNFTPELKQELRTAGERTSLHRTVTETVFRIFKARHKLIFFEHIEANKLRWEIINL
ncbi:MAG: hypothetical protein WBE34_16055 [Candidatus Nitrosopolaris sp.]